MSIRVVSGSGALEGRREGDIAVFRGIPYAAPPVGDRRWRPPAPVQPWSEVRDASRFGPAQVQNPGALGALLGIAVDRTDEDCLTLNVWTPDVAGRRPVMVWIHGGAFVIGAGSQPLYDGRRLAAQGDVVVVTLNYRLGVFGFLRAPRLGATGNEGLLDQIAALGWVRREIANFGGDPDNVTIFGESAGAISIGHLFGMPAADGLYRRAILQSGGASAAGDPAARDGIEDELLALLGLAPEDAERARQLPAETIYRAGQRLMAARVAGGVLAIPFGPFVGTPDLPVPPLDRMRAGVHRDVTVITGTCRDEMALFLAADRSIDALDDEALARRIARFVRGDPQALVIGYRAAAAARGAGASSRELLVDLLGDAVFRMPDIRIAEAQSLHQRDVWMYRFDWESPAFGGALGACHAVDLGFTFGTHAEGDHARFYGSGADADRLAAQVMDAWAAFARTGSPNVPGLPEWPRYDVADRSTMVLGGTCRVERGPGEAERLLWMSGE